MSVFEPNFRHLRGVLIFCVHLKKSAAEAHRMLSSTYGEAVLVAERVVSGFKVSRTAIWMSRIGMAMENRNFSKIPNWRQLAEDLCQTQKELEESLRVTQQAISKRLKAIGMIQLQGNWVPYELKPRDVERRFFAYEQLLQRQNRKGVLHRIVTGDEKWAH